MLEVDGLRKRYGEVTALDGITFRVGPGQLVGFLGPNGSGKTTTMRAILRLVSLDAGEVRWAGTPVTEEVRQRFGYMPPAPRVAHLVAGSAPPAQRQPVAVRARPTAPARRPPARTAPLDPVSGVLLMAARGSAARGRRDR